MIKNNQAAVPMNSFFGNRIAKKQIFENDPAKLYKGEDAQLDAAINLLKRLIKEDPREVPAPPAYPNKSFNNNKN